MRNAFLIAVLCLAQFARADYQIDRLEPGFWWVGMKNPSLQILVHGENIAELEPKLNHESVTLEKTHTVDNPNYLFLDLKLAENVAPGSFLIQFYKDGKRELAYDYQLHARTPGSGERVGFNGSDVIYLITPDRFANGDESNDEVEGLKEGLNRSDKFGRHGGDLKGIIDSLGFIDDMGYTQLWLNPVLENDQPSQSYHGYATTDYYKVDSRFGSNELYRKLSAEASERGIGLIMDMIPNHIGSEHWWMKDLPSDDWVNHGGEFVATTHRREAIQDPHAVKADRAAFSDGWFVPTMPDLNQRNPLLAQYLIQNSIWWVEYANLSGIRVDTYSYSDKEFLTEWARRILEEYPRLSIVGEEWSVNPAIVSYWQKGKENHDGYVSFLPHLMDFPLQSAVVSGLTAEENWGTGIIELHAMLANDFLYAEPDNLVVFPDNHDMDRIYTQVDESYPLFKMAMVYFLTTRGIPQIYYGTEILMSNSEHPGDHGVIRTDFPGGWTGDRVNAFTGKGLSEEQKEAMAFMKKLLNWRQSEPLVHYGAMTHYVPQDQVYVYFRHAGDDKIMVILNKNEEHVALETERFRRVLGSASKAKDVMTGKMKNIDESIELSPMSAFILHIH
jgi:glycosidase